MPPARSRYLSSSWRESVGSVDFCATESRLTEDMGGCRVLPHCSRSEGQSLPAGPSLQPNPRSRPVREQRGGHLLHAFRHLDLGTQSLRFLAQLRPISSEDKSVVERDIREKACIDRRGRRPRWSRSVTLLPDAPRSRGLGWPEGLQQYEDYSGKISDVKVIPAPNLGAHVPAAPAAPGTR
jgi:hypothetical protein